MNTYSKDEWGPPVSSMSGAFSATNENNFQGGQQVGRGRWVAYYNNANFNASRSSSIYGASSTVQTPAVNSYWIIKY